MTHIFDDFKKNLFRLKIQFTRMRHEKQTSIYPFILPFILCTHFSHYVAVKSKILNYFQESTEKYEFDFKNEMPLDSPNCKFEWHPVR